MLWFLVNDRRDAQFFSMYLFLFLTLYMFRAHRAHHQERQIVSIQPLVTVTLFTVGGRVVSRSEVNFRPAHDTTTDTEWQLPEVVLTQFVSPDDKHDVLETCRVKNKNKYIVKNCASRWSFTKNPYFGVTFRFFSEFLLSPVRCWVFVLQEKVCRC
jgi:hypothetical protein